MTKQEQMAAQDRIINSMAEAEAKRRRAAKIVRDRTPIHVHIPSGMRPYLHAIVQRGIFKDANELCIYFIRKGIQEYDFARWDAPSQAEGER